MVSPKGVKGSFESFFNSGLDTVVSALKCVDTYFKRLRQYAPDTLWKEETYVESDEVGKGSRGVHRDHL